MSVRYFEDFTVGETFTLGSYTITEDSIIAFAREFDPQPFHLDAERGRESIYGGLIASGWHTAAILMRLLVDGLLNDSASMGSPGIDELRWLQPVRPGDTLRGRGTVVAVTPSSRRPDRGTVRSTFELLNQRDEVVLRMTGNNIITRRPTPPTNQS